MSSSNVLTSVFSGAAETRRLEFKEGFNWEAQKSAKLKDELIKAILAMSNTPGGGTIILGVRSDTKKKKIFPKGFSEKDARSFIKNDEHIKVAVHNYCLRPIDFDVQLKPHPEDKNRKFVIFQIQEFSKWPTITVKPSKTKEDSGKFPVIEYHAIYARSKLAQWSSAKAGPQEIEDIVEIAVKKYDTHVQSLGYTRNKPRDKDIKAWFSSHQTQASKGLDKLGIQTYMEVRVKFLSADLDFKKIDLRDAARESTVSTFGWPIAVFLDNSDEYRPTADKGGIKAEIPIEKSALDGRKSFDYWAIHTSGAFYTLKSIFEDSRNPEIISFNTRIVRITEVLMYLKNLYSNLSIKLNRELEVMIKHEGIKGRRLGTLSQNRLMLGTYIASEDEVSTTVMTNISDFEEKPAEVVEKFTEPLFEQFNFYRVNRNILEEIVQNYLNGKVT